MAENEQINVEVTAENAQAPKGRKNFSGRAKGDRKDREPRQREASEFEKRVVEVRRVTKVVKGGRTLRFSALVVVGDGKGSTFLTGNAIFL